MMETTGEAISLSPALVVEDDPAMRLRLDRLLAEQPGAAVPPVFAGSLAEAKSCLENDAIRMALVDIGLPDGNGIELIAWLRTHRPQVPAVVISAWGDEDTVLAALRAGAIGYLLKEREDAELAMALQSIQRGGAPIDPFVARRILALLGTADKPTTPASPTPSTTGETLSERESEILRLVARGFSNREIAELTGLSRFTIESYTKSIYRKLAVGSRTAAVFEAKVLGLLH
jgi:DNA-binding NarL/FixJ family response regulator